MLWQLEVIPGPHEWERTRDGDKEGTPSALMDSHAE